MNRRLARLLLILSVFALCAAAAAQETNAMTVQSPMRVAAPPADATAQQLADKADALHGQKAYLDAVDYYRASLKKQNSSLVWNKLGITQLQMGKYDDAKKSFEKSTKLDKHYADALNNLGVIWYMRKKYSKAIKYYQRAITLRESASFLSNLGAAFFSKKEMVRSIAAYRRALELDPTVLERTSSTGVAAQLSSPEDRAHFSYVLAKLFAQSGNIDRSLDYLRRAMEDGYKGIDDVYRDQEFTALRKDPRFTVLMASKPVAIPQ